MNEISAAILPFILLPLVSCRIPVGQEADALVSHFRFEPEAFDSFLGVSRAHYSLSQASVTSLSIMKRTDDGKGTLVMTLFENLYETKGTHQHAWLGDTKDGTFASSGIYIGVLQTGAERFEAIVRVYHR
jgi:hypothetical protein